MDTSDLKKDWPTLVASIPPPDCDCEAAAIVRELQRRAERRLAKQAARVTKERNDE